MPPIALYLTLNKTIDISKNDVEINRYVNNKISC